MSICVSENELGIYLSRQVELSIEGFEVPHSIASNKFLVQPDLMVCRGTGEKPLAHFRRKRVNVSMKLRLSWNGRRDNISVQCSA